MINELDKTREERLARVNKTVLQLGVNGYNLDDAFMKEMENYVEGAITLGELMSYAEERLK